MANGVGQQKVQQNGNSSAKKKKNITQNCELDVGVIHCAKRFIHILCKIWGSKWVGTYE